MIEPPAHPCTHGDHLICVDIDKDGKSTCQGCADGRTCFGVGIDASPPPSTGVSATQPFRWLIADVEDKKPTNPKDSVGIAKVPLSAVPMRPLMEVGLGMMEGARKYGRHNYRIAGVRASVYFDAAQRHLAAFWEGEDIDPDSGLPHIIKAACCLFVLRDSQIVGNWNDDRPPSLDAGWVAELSAAAKAIIEKHPNAPEPFTRGSNDARGVSAGSGQDDGETGEVLRRAI